ncbi:hypothetical protein N9Y00_07130 [Tateyamaria sp.]|nr:hypothetical protein [Tateyamaria sp.]
MMPVCTIAGAAAIRRTRTALEQDALEFAQSEPEPAADPKVPEYSAPGYRFVPPIIRGSGPRKRFAAN